MAVKGLRNLCTPSYIYLVVSVIALVVMMYQNMGNVDKYCLGSYTCNVSSTALIFVIKAIYILFWTWVLNLICNAGAPGVAWFVLLLPIILLFVLLAGMMFYENTKEGFKEGVVYGSGSSDSGGGPPKCAHQITEKNCKNIISCEWTNNQCKQITPKSGSGSSSPCNPPCGNITDQKTCLATPAPTPSSHCYWNHHQGTPSHLNPPFTPYCATYSSKDPGPC